jgi:hypothetical protein
MPSPTGRRLLRIAASLSFLALAVFSVFGFLACGEDWAGFWHWAVGYAVVGVSSLVSAGLLIFR